MKKITKEQKILWIVSMIFIYVAIAIVGFFVVYFVKNILYTKQTTPTPTASVTVAPAAGFKNYQVIKGKALISYPEALKVSESSYGMGAKTTDFYDPQSTDPKAFHFQTLSASKNLVKLAGQDFDKFYAMKDGQKEIIQSPTSETKETFTKVRNRTINNLKAIEYTSIPEPVKKDSILEIGVLIDVNGTLVIITTDKNHRTEFESILKTFKQTP